MRQFKEWEEYYSVEPWGDDQHEARNGMLCSLIANVNRDTKKKRDPFMPRDFMRGPAEPEVELTDAQIERELDRLFGG